MSHPSPNPARFAMRRVARPFLPFAILAALASGIATAEAGERRIVVSPDLNAPWVLGFEGAPRSSSGGGVRVGSRAPAVRPVPPAPRGSRSTGASRSGVQVMRRAAPPPRVETATLRSRSAARNGFHDRFLPTTVAYAGKERAGTIVIDTNERFLYLVGKNGQARRYGVGVGKPGFEWAGGHKITRKAVWPSWTPPKTMIMRERLEGRELPAFMEGGPANPMGARALYLGSSLYRIHGTNQPWTIGQAVSSGCIRMRNIDVTDLYERVGVGTRVIVR